VRGARKPSRCALLTRRLEADEVIAWRSIAAEAAFGGARRSLERYYAIADILKHDAVVRAWLRDHFRGDKVGWVYFALVRSARLIKIGFSQAIPSRLATLQTNSAHAVQIIKRIRGTRADERAWHREFEDLRRRGEWFHAAPRLLKAIRTATASRQ
jgi:hypothetical protein